MSRLYTLPVIFALTACPKQIGLAPSPAAIPQVAATLDTAASFAAFAADLAPGDPVLCFTGHAVAAALRSGADGVLGAAGGGALLPGINVDVSMCLGETPVGVDLDEAITTTVESSVDLVLGLITAWGDKMPCEARVWALGALEHAGGVASAVLEEIAAPDGIVVVPSVEVEVCE